jgi:hypoxanthine phosphoribosyltransferase
MHKDILKVLITKPEIEERVKELGGRITEDYKGKDVLMICILRGAALFFADLVRAVNLDVKLDFMAISSYRGKSLTSGEVRIIKDLSQPIEGQDVIIVEDIIDSGKTLNYLKNLLLQRNPASVKVCTFLDKPERREVEIRGDYVGFSVPNEFVVGYGLDYNEKYRNIEEVSVLKASVYGG